MPEPKYKAGDRVRVNVREGHYGGEYKLEFGIHTGTITGIYFIGGPTYCIEYDDFDYSTAGDHGINENAILGYAPNGLQRALEYAKECANRKSD